MVDAGIKICIKEYFHAVNESSGGSGWEVLQSITLYVEIQSTVNDV